MLQRFLACIAVLAIGAQAFGGTVKCQASRDVWLSSHRSEADFNMGKASSIKLKFVQEFGIIDFNVDALKGKKIKEAWLYVKAAGGHKWGLNGGTDLRYVSLSTVGKDWVEGKSNRYAKDEAGKGATFNESSYKTANWGWPGAKVYSVTLGNWNSYRAEGELKPSKGWHRTKVDPFLVKALVAKASHGIFIMDGVGDIMMNCKIASRESRGKGPYLEVVVEGDDAQAPSAPTQVSVKPASTWATTKLGALMVSLKAPADCVAYHIKVNGKAVDRWKIPYAKPGEVQTFPILDLPAGGSADVEVVAVDGAGNMSPPAKASGTISSSLKVPAIPAFPFNPKSGAPKTLGGAKVWAFPEVTKVDPATGKVLHEKNAADYASKNPVWDGASGTVRLAAAKGEIVSFQIALQGAVQSVKVDVSDLKGTSDIPKKGVRLWRNWYVKNQSEYAIPLNGAVSCPMADNGVQGQTLQAVTVDYHIPLATKAGDYKGKVTLTAGGNNVELPLKVKVYNCSIPDTTLFTPDLNCYGGPGNAGSDQFIKSHQLAHYHRVVINRVPYSQSGRTHGDMVPKVDASGHVTDWSAFDKNLGGAFDGSWFKDNPRAGMPVNRMYIPLYEGWPLNYRNHYKPGCSVPGSGGKSKEARSMMTKHHIQAKAIEESMSKAYQDAFLKCTREFVEHFKAKGWNKTIFQMYQNNKGWKSKSMFSMWTLDEPYKYADWKALNFWAGLLKKAINDPEVYSHAWHEKFFKVGGLQAMNRNRPTFMYRGDISRIHYQGSCSDGLMTQVYGGGGTRMMRGHRTRAPMLTNTYGGANNWKRNNWESAAWCLKAYVTYNDAVCPWQSLGRDDALKTGDKSGSGNALIIKTNKFGPAIASFRVHALRRGTQDVEMLRLLQVKKGWSRDHIGMLVNQRVPMGGEHQVTDAAAAMKFGSMSSQGFVELKEGILQLLAK